MPSRRLWASGLNCWRSCAGLEALDQPSRVTLVTSSKYVHRGLLYGLQEWRSNDWMWEHFGEMAPVKNRDLWQRLDHALAFHELDFRPWRFDVAAPETAFSGAAADPTPSESLAESADETAAPAHARLAPPRSANARRAVAAIAAESVDSRSRGSASTVAPRPEAARDEHRSRASNQPSGSGGDIRLRPRRESGWRRWGHALAEAARGVNPLRRLA